MHQIKSPIDYTTANDIMVQDGVISALDFTECFAELLDAQTIAEYKSKSGEQLFYVTERGEHVVVTLQDSLSSSLRERCVRSAMLLLSFKNRGTKLDCEIIPREDGFYMLHCTIKEKTGVLLELTLSVPTKQQAERMAFGFTDNPEETYRAVYTALKGNSPIY